MEHATRLTRTGLDDLPHVQRTIEAMIVGIATETTEIRCNAVTKVSRINDLAHVNFHAISKPARSTID